MSDSDAARRARPAPHAAVAAVLLLATCAAFWPVLGNDFVGYDDGRYVTDNRHVQGGLTAAGVRWALTTFHASNWHPLTWVSHMLDQELWGDRAFGHHLTSLLLHVANALLLYFVLERASGAWRRSAAAAALFALHPLHVESVAWVAERKDVLSTLCWFAMLGAWVRYVRAPGLGRYLVVALIMAIGLTAKPMLVTAPLTLLLFDVWPLERCSWDASDRLPGLARLLVEKLPLLALSAASCAVTLAAQSRALGSLEVYPFAARAGNALVAYATYLWKTALPVGLAVHYPYPAGGPSPLAIGGSAIVLLAISTAVLRYGKRHPYLLVGWLWYVGTLVPVIGLVQVGRQALADRYTYVPLVGIFVIVAWGVPDLAGALARRTALRSSARTLGAAAVLLLGLLAVGSHAQARVWRDARTLFEHALAVAPENAVAHNVLGQTFAERGQLERVIEHYERALALNPNFAEAHNNLGGAWAELGRPERALDGYRAAVRADPGFAEARNNLGVALAQAGDPVAGLAELDQALKLRPDYGTAHANRAIALYSLGRYDEARRAVELARANGFEPPAAFVELLREAR